MSEAKKANAAKAASETMGKVFEQGNQAFEQGRETVEQIVNNAREQAGRASEKAMKDYRELANIGRDNMEAFFQARNLFVSSIEDLSQDIFAFTQQISERQAQFANNVARARNFSDLTETNASFVRDSAEAWYQEGQKISDKLYQLGQKAVAPLESRTREQMGYFTKSV